MNINSAAQRDCRRPSVSLHLAHIIKKPARNQRSAYENGIGGLQTCIGKKIGCDDPAAAAEAFQVVCNNNQRGTHDGNFEVREEYA